MDYGGDFIQWLGADMSTMVFMHLDDPSDLVRISAVSSSLRQFVVANGLCKQLCLKMFPEISSVAYVIEVKDVIEPVEVGPNNSLEWERLKRDHRVYAFLARGFTSFMTKDCIEESICASSTDNYPEESIQNTLESNDTVEQSALYWSSKGASDPSVPETLVYKLIANLCVITEVHVQPFQAYFQFGFPIYSVKAVRFRMGHPKYPMELDFGITNISATDNDSSDKFIWTYTSPEFPMSQENVLQKFKLPEPVLCIGGILQIELLGRVQRQEMDGLYYICVSHVQVVGRPLSPAFDVDILDSSGNCTLKYYPEADYSLSPKKSSEGETSTPSRFRTFTETLMQRGVRGWEQVLLHTLLGTGAIVGDDDSDDDAYF